MNLNYINLMTSSLKVGFLLSIITISIVISQTSALINQPLMASAITFDLTLSLPIAYWLFIRKTKISKRTTAVLIIFGIILASFILPENNRQLLDYLKYFALPVIELGLLAYTGFIIYKSRKTYKLLIQNRQDFLEVLRETLTAEFPSAILAKAVSFEIAGFYYAFVGWKSRRGEHLFSYHKKNGTAVLLIVFGFIVAVETFVLHILIAKWSVIIAWVLTAFSIYFLFQIFAHAKAILLRPMEIAEDKLFIRCGLLGDAEIELTNIASINHIKPPIAPKDGEIKLSPVGEFTACNLKIILRNGAVLNGLYGKKKNFNAIFLAVDEAEILKAEIEKQTVKYFNDKCRKN